MSTLLKLIFVITIFVNTCFAISTINVPMYYTSAQGKGEFIGNIMITETPYGLLFSPNLSKLSPGQHGFHIHQHPDCGDSGMAAGPHLDPNKTDKHLGPYEAKGHLGDLPVLVAFADGTARIPLLAPKFKKLTAVKQHALMIHAGGDNYQDKPEKLGGGGAKMVCGVIPG